MGRLKDRMLRPFHRQRYKGLTVPDYVLDEYGVPREHPAPSAPGAPPPPQKKTETVNIDNGFFSPLAPSTISFIDYTDGWDFDYDTLTSGQVEIQSKTVPPGRAWYIDDMYFFATAVGGVFGSYIVGPSALSLYMSFKVFTSSSQLEYESIPSLLPGLPKTTFPLLNDRIGPREATFGVTLFEGDYIRATVEQRAALVPPAALEAILFRFMGIEGSKQDIEDYLRLKRWNH